VKIRTRAATLFIAEDGVARLMMDLTCLQRALLSYGLLTQVTLLWDIYEYGYVSVSEINISGGLVARFKGVRCRQAAS